MWSWKIHAANLTFSSVVEFPIYCDSEISAQHFPPPPVLQGYRLNKPDAVFRIFRTEGISWLAVEQLIFFSSLIQAPSLWPTKSDGGKSPTFIVVSPQVLLMSRTTVLPQGSDGKAQSRVQHVWTSGPAVLLQWRTSGPEHSSQALLGSTCQNPDNLKDAARL